MEAINIKSAIDKLKYIIKESKKLVQENPELSEPEARKIISEQLKNKE
jgi:hypothetical protein